MRGADLGDRARRRLWLGGAARALRQRRARPLPRACDRGRRAGLRGHAGDRRGVGGARARPHRRRGSAGLRPGSSRRADRAPSRSRAEPAAASPSEGPVGALRRPALATRSVLRAGSSAPDLAAHAADWVEPLRRPPGAEVARAAAERPGRGGAAGARSRRAPRAARRGSTASTCRPRRSSSPSPTATGTSPTGRFPAGYLDPAYLAERRALIDRDRAARRSPARFRAAARSTSAASTASAARAR